jgi:hypothetical protein
VFHFKRPVLSRGDHRLTGCGRLVALRLRACLSLHRKLCVCVCMCDRGRSRLLPLPLPRFPNPSTKPDPYYHPHSGAREHDWPCRHVPIGVSDGPTNMDRPLTRRLDLAASSSRPLASSRAAPPHTARPCVCRVCAVCVCVSTQTHSSRELAVCRDVAKYLKMVLSWRIHIRSNRRVGVGLRVPVAVCVCVCVCVCACARSLSMLLKEPDRDTHFQPIAKHTYPYLPTPSRPALTPAFSFSF